MGRGLARAGVPTPAVSAFFVATWSLVSGGNPPNPSQCGCPLQSHCWQHPRPLYLIAWSSQRPPCLLLANSLVMIVETLCHSRHLAVTVTCPVFLG